MYQLRFVSLFQQFVRLVIITIGRRKYASNASKDIIKTDLVCSHVFLVQMVKLHDLLELYLRTTAQVQSFTSGTASKRFSALGIIVFQSSRFKDILREHSCLLLRLFVS
jgi:hypothetical protein